MYSNHQWNEADHPRDDDGKFTFKGLGSLRNNGFIGAEKNDISIHGIDIGNMKEILLKVLKNFIVPGVTIYATVNQLMKMIKQNKLEDKLEKAIQEFRNNNNKQNLNNNNQEAADILYKDSKIKEQKEKKESEYKSKLLNILGDKATHADILYAKPKELEEKIRENGLGKELNKIKTWEAGIELSRIPVLGRLGASILGGPDSAGMLNIAENKRIPIYTKDAIELNNINDIATMHSSLSRFKPYMEDKIKEQFKDFNYNVNDIKGYVFKNNSAVVDRIKESKEFKNIINSNIDKILNGEKFSGRFKNDSNLHNAFGSVDFLNSGIDKQGDLHLYMFDTYDFNKNESPKIEAGRRQMIKGNLKGFFTIHEIIVPQEYYGKYGVEG